MQNKTNQPVGWLINELKDPFVYFPIQSVGKSLNDLIEKVSDEFSARQGPYGVSRKYWDVPSELMHEEIGLLLGAAFVLGQATLTQSLSIVNKLRMLRGTLVRIPEGKQALLSYGADVHVKTGLSHIEIIDLAANYFKHHHEWPDDWNIYNATRLQSKTIDNCKRLGMMPGDITDNLHKALCAIGAHSSDVEQIQQSIEIWREHLASNLYAMLRNPD